MKYYSLFIIIFIAINLALSRKCNVDTTGYQDYEKEHLSELDKYSAECTVLLRSNGDFPLTDDKVKDIYLYGNGARNTLKGGTGSGDVVSRPLTTIEDAFTQCGYNVKTKDFMDQYDETLAKAKEDYKNELHSKINTKNFSEVFALLGIIMPEPDYDIPYEKEGDVAIYVLSRVSGEGNDRNAVKGDVYLSDTEKKMITDLNKGFKKFLLVLNTGGPVDLSGLEDVKNILLLSQLGFYTSKTLVDIVSGNKYPSGKLATTWTKFEDYQTIGDFGDKKNTNYKEGVYVGYRYFDSANVDVMFPFGFGLGYTDFSIDVKSVKLKNETFEIKTIVKNTGNFLGKEVIEVYLSKPGTTIDEPYQILVGFAKTKELKPNQKANIKISFKLSDFASYDTKTATYFLDKGEYVVRVGNSSRNTKPCGIINVDKRIDVKKVKNLVGNTEFEDYVPTVERKPEDLSKVEKFDLKAKSIKTKKIDYKKKYEIIDEVKNLTTDKKIRLVVGYYEDNEILPLPHVNTTAGIAGSTANVAGLKRVIMADGPAGLRLSKDYYITEKGPQTTMGAFPPSAIEFFTEEFKARYILTVPDDAELLQQYTTAIPIGTAVAQTWNLKMAEVFGSIVGAEMEMFNINLWLAPALNIHRSILCGRNFEYYSEDPLISGLFAASVTDGVQSHHNTYVTLKHFLANNQENNRYLSSSNVSERAFREIYLKGFEIVIKNCNIKALMTSYNLINGVHVNESKNITNGILRNELDYNGIVTTDWLGVFTDTVPYKVIKATGDLIMNGKLDYFKNIKEALNSKDKKIKIEDIEISASRIYEFAKQFDEEDDDKDSN